MRCCIAFAVLMLGIAQTSAHAAGTQAQCPALDRIDFAALAALHFDAADARKSLDGATDKPQLGDADVVLRLFAPPGFSPPPRYSIAVTARRVNGHWSIDRARRRVAERGQLDHHDGETATGALPTAVATVLDTALADPCLAREPDFAPRVLPLLGGAQETCMDGSTFFLQIERAQGVRTFRHDCMARWRAGEIMLALRAALPDPATPRP